MWMTTLKLKLRAISSPFFYFKTTKNVHWLHCKFIVYKHSTHWVHLFIWALITALKYSEWHFFVAFSIIITVWRCSDLLLVVTIIDTEKIKSHHLRENGCCVNVCLFDAKLRRLGWGSVRRLSTQWTKWEITVQVESFQSNFCHLFSVFTPSDGNLSGSAHASALESPLKHQTPGAGKARGTQHMACCLKRWRGCQGILLNLNTIMDCALRQEQFIITLCLDGDHMNETTANYEALKFFIYFL